MEATMRVTPVVQETAGYDRMLFLRPHTLVQRHVCNSKSIWLT